MRKLLLLPLLVTQPCLAGALLDPAGAYPLKAELKEAGVTPKNPESFRSEMQMDFESFDVNDASGQPMITTHTDQLLRLKHLPPEAKGSAAEKEGLADKLELTFERLVSTSKVRVPNLPKPFETRSDLSSFLSTRPLLIRGDGKTPKKIENLEKVKAEALAQITDLMSRSTVVTLLNESTLLRTGAGAKGDSSCLSGLGGRKPGEKWKFSLEEQGVKLDYDCEFQGWSEAKGKKVALLRVVANKQRTVRPQPNGVNGVAETSGEGIVVFEPETRESLMRMETKILVEPMEDEIERLKGRGQVVPRNRSVMKHWNHLYPL